jgi:hypothetical protein
LWREGVGVEWFLEEWIGHGGMEGTLSTFSVLAPNNLPPDNFSLR